mgnify:FL=1
MRRSIETLKNIWKIEDLRKRILITVLFVAIYRFGSYIVLPGIDPNMLTKLHEQTSEGLLALLNMFSGGAFSNASIFALGIMPYISASIVIQLLAVAVPYFQKMQREGESGRRKINQYTRYLTIAILLFQAPSYLLNLKSQAGGSLNASLDWTLFMISSTIILAAGSMFILWLGERITDKGVGNGISLIIFAGIVSRLPDGMHVSFQYLQAGTVNILNVILFAVIALAMIVFVVAISQGIRKIPVQYAKRVVGRKMYGGHTSYIPLKVNQAGVIPIIFASSVLMFPVTIGQFVDIPWVKTVAGWFAWGTPLQTTLYVLMILFFTYFYTAVSVNIAEMSDNIKNMAVYSRTASWQTDN